LKPFVLLSVVPVVLVFLEEEDVVVLGGRQNLFEGGGSLVLAQPVVRTFDPLVTFGPFVFGRLARVFSQLVPVGVVGGLLHLLFARVVNLHFYVLLEFLLKQVYQIFHG